MKIATEVTFVYFPANAKTKIQSTSGSASDSLGKMRSRSVLEAIASSQENEFQLEIPMLSDTMQYHRLPKIPTHSLLANLCVADQNNNGILYSTEFYWNLVGRTLKR